MKGRGWGRWKGGTHDELAQPLELHHVRCEDCTPVSFDDCHVLADHVQPVRVNDDVHSPLFREVQGELREREHVVFATKARADDQDV